MSKATGTLFNFDITRGGVSMEVRAYVIAAAVPGNPHAHPDKQEPGEPARISIGPIRLIDPDEDMYPLLANAEQYMGDIERYAEQLAAKMNDEEPK